MMKFAYLLFAVSLAGIFLFAQKSGVFNLGTAKYKQAYVAIRGERFKADVADTLASRELGLGGREGIPEGGGMLFVFDSLANRTFWMKDVGFPIDIVWIAKDKVVGFAENTKPHGGESFGQIARYSSPEPVDMVLEVAAGTVGEAGIIIGDGVKVSFVD